MAYYRGEEKAKLKRYRTKEAISLAMQSRWEEAVAANRSIIEIFPTDVDAYNRLGKALTELGRYDEAKEAYRKALEIEPGNRIAKRNFSRLSHLGEGRLGPKDGHGVEPRLFIEETGKAGLVELHYLASKEVLSKMAAGDRVFPMIKGRSLIVENGAGEYLGQVEPKPGARLVKLMEGGNKYVAAIASLGDDGGKVIIREVFQHPSQAGRPSFLAKAADSFRAYIKESLLKYELEDEEEPVEEEEYPSGWKGELEPVEDEVSPLSTGSEPEEEDMESEEN